MSSILNWKKQLSVADFLELGELMCIDALTPYLNHVVVTSVKNHKKLKENNKVKQNVKMMLTCMYVGAWEFKGQNHMYELHKEELKYDVIKVSQRSYK
jgi:succinate dehydrogenase / fumarate reductase flavoprotein subunit